MTKLFDGAVQTGIEVNESVCGPEFLTEFLARNHVTCMLQLNGEHLEGLVLKLQTDAVLVQFPRAQVHFVGPEASLTGSGSRFHRRRSSLAGVYHQLLGGRSNMCRTKRVFPGTPPEFNELDDQMQNM